MQVKVRDMMFKFDGDDDKVVVTIDGTDADEDTLRGSAILAEFTERIVKAKNAVAGVVDRSSVDDIVKRIKEDGEVQILVEI